MVMLCGDTVGVRVVFGAVVEFGGGAAGSCFKPLSKTATSGEYPRCLHTVL